MDNGNQSAQHMNARKRALAGLSVLRQHSLHIFNLCKGSSILEMVNAFEGVSGKPIRLKVTEKRT